MQKIKKIVEFGAQSEFCVHKDDSRLSIPKVSKLKNEILEETHNPAYMIHLKGTKI